MFCEVSLIVWLVGCEHFTMYYLTNFEVLFANKVELLKVIAMSSD